MAWAIDARVPVRFGPDGDADADAKAGAGEAVLAVPPGLAHAPGCACCAPRSAAAAALARLLEQRARGEVPFFRAVLARDADRPAVEDALRTDPVASARYRLG